MAQVLIRPVVLRWALERSGKVREELERRFPKLGAGLQGRGGPTLRQAEQLAAAAGLPLGYLLLREPPEERLALRMRAASGLAAGWAEGAATWEDALRTLRERMEEAGVTVCVSGIVGNNTRRALRVAEFRGFVLVDGHAPWVCVNGADAKAAQMSTLAHELDHLNGTGSVRPLTWRSCSRPATRRRWCARLGREAYGTGRPTSSRGCTDEPLRNLPCGSGSPVDRGAGVCGGCQRPCPGCPPVVRLRYLPCLLEYARGAGRRGSDRQH